MAGSRWCLTKRFSSLLTVPFETFPKSSRTTDPKTMVVDLNFLSNLIPAAAGLCGVWLGATLTSKREESREATRSQKEASYLAILVVTHLDRFVNGCARVVSDDGTSYGQPAGKDGVYETTVEPPDFDPLSLDVEWKSLPSKLMYEILSLPYAIEMLNHRIEAAGEYDSPPDYADFFWERRHGYAYMGLKVSELACQVRQHAGLPNFTYNEGDWNREGYMREQKDRLEKLRDKHHRSMSLDPLNVQG